MGASLNRFLKLNSVYRNFDINDLSSIVIQKIKSYEYQYNFHRANLNSITNTLIALNKSREDIISDTSRENAILLLNVARSHLKHYESIYKELIEYGWLKKSLKEKGELNSIPLDDIKFENSKFVVQLKLNL